MRPLIVLTAISLGSRGRQMFCRFRVILFTTHANDSKTAEHERSHLVSCFNTRAAEELHRMNHSIKPKWHLGCESLHHECVIQTRRNGVRIKSFGFHLGVAGTRRKEMTLWGFILDFIFINWSLTSSYLLCIGFHWNLFNLRYSAGALHHTRFVVARTKRYLSEESNFKYSLRLRY